MFFEGAVLALSLAVLADRAPGQAWQPRVASGPESGVSGRAGGGSRRGGGMPSFAGRLTKEQIRDVAAFVAKNAGR